MKTQEIINWLRDKLPYAPDHAWKHKMQETIAMLTRLKANLKTAGDQLNEYQEKYLAERERNAVLEAVLKDEMYRHDRLQDFEVAEAEELAKLKEQHRWIPVTERLPEHGQIVLAFAHYPFDEQGTITVAEHEPENKVFWGIVTHWMPMPEPAKEGE